jgi:hypothetical protein
MRSICGMFLGTQRVSIDRIRVSSRCLLNLTTCVAYSSDVLDDLSATDLECVINVYVALESA